MSKLTQTQFANILISEEGKVYDTNTNQYLTVRLNKSTNYMYVNINGQIISHHRLVCITFHGNPVGDKKFVNHIDNDKTNNHKDNLEWITRKENNAKSRAARLANEVNPILTDEQMDDMIATYLTGYYTLTDITHYMNTKYNRNSLKPTYGQVLKGVNKKKYWASLSTQTQQEILAITKNNRRCFNN